MEKIVLNRIGNDQLVLPPMPAGALKCLTMLKNPDFSLKEAAAESVALAEALGLDPRLLLDTLEGSPTGSPYLRLKGEAILDRRLDPQFRLALAAKDARLLVEAAEAEGIDLPLARTVRERLERAIMLGHGDQDMAATYFASAESPI